MKLLINEKTKTNFEVFFKHVLFKAHENTAQLNRFVDLVNSELTDRELLVIGFRYGLIEEKKWSLLEVANRYKTTRDRVREIEAKAIKKLRHPTRLKQVFNDDKKNVKVISKDTPIGESGLPLRARAMLIKENIHTVGDLLKTSIKDVFGIPNLGRKAALDIAEFVERNYKLLDK